MSANNTDTCYEFFNCKELTCARREKHTQQCWEIDDVRCQSHSKQFDYIKTIQQQVRSLQALYILPN